MPADKLFSSPSAFAAELRELREQRKRRTTSTPAPGRRRPALTPAERSKVLEATGGRCHICGGSITSKDWEADHVLARSAGGAHSPNNYLPSHSLCNNYRWHYESDEFQWILKLGVWARTQIEKETSLGQVVGRAFCEHEKRRSLRRKSST
jgi:5-methylcytosine-specific restriction endonuclease McrA